MAKTVEKLLSEINFSRKEQAVYLAILELGEAPVSPIAKRARINRGTAYDILRSLVAKGLVAKSIKNRKLYYSALGVEGLEGYLDAQKSDWEEKLEHFYNLKTQLAALSGSAGVRPAVRFFEGKMGVKEVFLDQIRGEHKEILSYSVASKLEEMFGTYIKTFARQKARAGIVTRVVAPEERALTKYLEKYYQSRTRRLFNIKTVPKESFPFGVEMNIYGNKVALISLEEEELVGIIIESPVLAKNQRLIFELLWSKL